jgi:hypothetical protein
MADRNDLTTDAAAVAANDAQRKDMRRSVVRRIGGREPPTYIEQVRAPSGKPYLLVVERLARDATVSDEQAASYVSAARSSAGLQHANVVRGRAVSVRHDEIVVACDFVDGERLSELWRTLAARGSTLPTEIAVRILVDVLAGLEALHGHSDPKNPGPKLVHGELTSANVLVGADGVSRVLHAARIRRPGLLPADAGSIAPEVVAKGPVDARADVFSVGVLLWQALSGIAALADATDTGLVVRIRTGKVERAPAPKDVAWGAKLVDVAARAMSVSPADRFGSASAMSAELRKIAGDKMAGAPAVAAFLRVNAGAKIDERRQRAQAAEAAVAPSPSTGAHAPAAPARFKTTQIGIKPPPIDAAKTSAAPKPPPPPPAPPAPKAQAAAPAPAKSPAEAPIIPGPPPAPSPPPAAPKPPAKPLASTAVKGSPAPAAAKAPPAPAAPKPPAAPTAAKPPAAPAAAKPLAAPAAPKPPPAAVKPAPAAPAAKAPAPAAAVSPPVPAKPLPAPAPAPAAKPPAPAVAKAPAPPAAPATKAAPAPAAAKVPPLPVTPPPIPAPEPPPLEPAAAIRPSRVVDIDAEAESIPPSGPSEDRPTFPKVFDPPPKGLTPAVSEKPVPIEPKVVIASKAGGDDGQEIDLSVDPPSSKGGGFVPSFGAAAPAPIPAPAPAKAAPERQRADTPAANPVMAPAPLAMPAPAPTASLAEPTTDLALPRKPRPARAIVAAVAAVCLVIGGIAGYRAWQKSATTSAAGDAPVEPPPTAPPPPTPPLPRPIATPAEPPAPPVAAPHAAPVESPAPPPQPKTAPPVDQEPDEEDRSRTSPRGPRPPSVETPPAAPPPPPPPPPRPKFDPKRI